MKEEAHRLASDAERGLATVLLLGSSRSVLPCVSFLNLKVSATHQIRSEIPLASPNSVGGGLVSLLGQQLGQFHHSITVYLIACHLCIGTLNGA